MDIKFKLFSIDIGNVSWLLRGVILFIHKENDMCFFVFSDTFQILTNFDWFTCLGQLKFRRVYPYIDLEFIEERSVCWTQLESNPVDEHWVDSLGIIIDIVEMDSVCLNLSEFGDDFFLCQVFQDLNFVDFEDFSEEFFGCSSTLLSFCVNDPLLRAPR